MIEVPKLGDARSGPLRSRRAVLAGVGESYNDPSVAPTDAVAMMNAAAQQAAANIGVPDIFDDVGLICANVASDDQADPAGAAQEYLGLIGAKTIVAAIGIPQQRLVSHAILAVESGETDAVLILGGEAKASANAARRAGKEPMVIPTGPGAGDFLAPSGEFLADPELNAGLWDAFVQYAMIDSAIARHESVRPADHLQQVSELYARFDQVAATNPNAMFSGGYSADDLATISDDNRLLAFPYNKHHSTQWALDHGAALIICSEDLAKRKGLSDEDLLHPVASLDTSWGLSLSRRAEPHRWQTMNVLGDAAAEWIGADMASIDVAEIYSCFPAAVRAQQRELNLPLDGTPTVTGGMAFAGGPLNHFTYLATATVADTLKASDSSHALLTTVSGLLTKGGLMIWGKEPHPRGALVADVASEAEAATGKVEVDDFDESVDPTEADNVLAATVTGGFNPRLIALSREGENNAITASVAPPEMVANPAPALNAL